MTVPKPVCPECGAPAPSPYGLDLPPVLWGEQFSHRFRAHFCATCGADLGLAWNRLPARRIEDLPGYEPSLPRAEMLRRVCETLEERIAYDTALLRTARVLLEDEEKRRS